MEIRDTWEYQWKAVSFLAAALADGHRKLGLSSPTGSGKTLMVATLLLKSRALLDGVVLATPSRPVLGNFHKNWRVRLVAPPLYDRPPFLLESDMNDMFVLLDTQHNKRRLFDDIVKPGRVDFQWVALTTMQQLTRWGVGCLPSDLKGKLLILDEGHHAGSGDEGAEDDPQIGKFAQEWVARGGAVLWVTATPFRSQRLPRSEGVSMPAQFFGAWQHPREPRSDPEGFRCPPSSEGSLATTRTSGTALRWTRFDARPVLRSLATRGAAYSLARFNARRVPIGSLANSERPAGPRRSPSFNARRVP